MHNNLEIINKVMKRENITLDSNTETKKEKYLVQKLKIFTY